MMRSNKSYTVYAMVHIGYVMLNSGSHNISNKLLLLYIYTNVMGYKLDMTSDLASHYVRIVYGIHTSLDSP
jgi:hypothetical protein